MPFDFHIPECQDVLCKRQLNELSRRLKEDKFTIAEYTINGHFFKQFKTQFKKSRYTILLKCPSLWQKIKDIDKLEEKNIICVQLNEIQTNNLDHVQKQRFEDFFKDFFVIHHINTEADILAFINTIRSNRLKGIVFAKSDNNSSSDASTASSSENSQQFANDYNNIEDIYTNYQEANSTEKVALNNLETMKQTEAKKIQTSDDKYCACHDAFGNEDEFIIARNIDGPNECEHFLNYGSYENFEEMKREINLLSSKKESFTVNIKFILRKVIPNLYRQKCLIGLLSISLCDHFLLQTKAQTFLELLLLNGQIINSPNDLKSLETLLRMVASSLSELKRKLRSKDDEKILEKIKNQCILFAILESEMAIGSKGASEIQCFQTFNREISSKMSVGDSQDEESNQYFITIDNFLKTPVEELQKTFREFTCCRDKKESLPNLPNLLKKTEPHHVLVIWLCLKKIFSSKDPSAIEFGFLSDFLKKALNGKIKKANNADTNMLSIKVIFRGLTHFLVFLIRELSHKDVSKLCSRATDIIRGVSSKSISFIAEEDLFSLVPLMFDPAPILRKTMIDLFKFWENYEFEVSAYNVFQIMQMLHPVLYVTQQEKNKLMKQTRTDKGWFRVFGKYKGIPAIIYINILNEDEHKTFDKSESDDPKTRLNLNEIKTLYQLNHPNIVTLFACQTDRLPQFFITEDFTSETLPDNITLQEYLINRSNNRKYCSQSSLLTFLLQLSEALAYCHDNNVIHRNLTAASALVVNSNTVKLGCFKFAMEIKDQSVINKEFKSFLPARWTAQESHRRSIFSKESDVWMFGHLAYEILTHGAQPYSDIKIDDFNCVLEICSLIIRLNQEKCFSEEQYKLISHCTEFEPSDRPTIHSVREIIKEIIQQESKRKCVNYPNLKERENDSCSQLSENIIAPCVKPMPLKFYRKMSEKMSLYIVSRGFVVRQLVYRNISAEFLEQQSLGTLDSVIPSLVIRELKRDCYFMDVNIAYDLRGNVLEILLNKDMGKTTDIAHLLLLKIAEMIEKLHSKHFVLGDIRASQLFIEMCRDDIIKIRPVCMGNLHYLVKENREFIESKLDPDTVSYLRAAPEWREHGQQSKASDIYSFGVLALDMIAAMDCKKTGKIEVFEHKREFVTQADIMERDIQFSKLKRLDEIYHPSFVGLLKRCLNEDPRLRPTVGDILSHFRNVSWLSEYNPSTISTASIQSSLSEDDPDSESSAGYSEGYELDSLYDEIEIMQSQSGMIFAKEMIDENNWILRRSDSTQASYDILNVSQYSYVDYFIPTHTKQEDEPTDQVMLRENNKARGLFSIARFMNLDSAFIQRFEHFKEENIDSSNDYDEIYN